MLALDFPPINEVLRWRDLIPGIGFNKISLIVVLAVVISVAVFFAAIRKDPMKPPTGVRNFAEVLVEFIEQQIIMPTVGRSGLGWTPFLLTLFVFIFLCNIPGIIPFLQMPASRSRCSSRSSCGWCSSGPVSSIRASATSPTSSGHPACRPHSSRSSASSSSCRP